MKTLLLVYSRTGTTQNVARDIARASGATMHEIKDVHGRGGLFGYLRSAYEALTGRTPAFEPLPVDPATYDLVILGAPVWAGRLAAPMRSFLTQYQSRLPRVAFFCTMGSTGGEHALREMTHGAGQLPVATMALAHDDIATEAGARKIEQFVALLARASGLPDPDTAKASYIPAISAMSVVVDLTAARERKTDDSTLAQRPGAS
jgi:flavodoxin